MFLIEEAHISWPRELTDMLHCTLPSQLTFLFLYPINFKVTTLPVNSTNNMLFSEKVNLAWIVFHSCFALSISGFSDFFFFLLISYFLIIRLIEEENFQVWTVSDRMSWLGWKLLGGFLLTELWILPIHSTWCLSVFREKIKGGILSLEPSYHLFCGRRSESPLSFLKLLQLKILSGNPLQCSCLENPRDRGAWWAAVYGVAQSWTQLKWLSSSSSSHYHSFSWLKIPIGYMRSCQLLMYKYQMVFFFPVTSTRCDLSILPFLLGGCFAARQLSPIY